MNKILKMATHFTASMKYTSKAIVAHLKSLEPGLSVFAGDRQRAHNEMGEPGVEVGEFGLVITSDSRILL